MHLRLADAFLCGAIGISDDVEARRQGVQGVQGVQDITLEIVDGDGRSVRMNWNNGIGRVGEMKTDQTIVFLNLRDGLTHEETAISTGVE